jgi:hypothetical protein
MPKKMPSANTSTKPPLASRRVRPLVDYELHTHMLLNRLSEEIKQPPDQYRLDLLLPSRTKGYPRYTPSFELGSWCRSEDIRRSVELQHAVNNIPLVLKPITSLFGIPDELLGMGFSMCRYMLDLAARLRRSGHTAMLSSASFKSDQRIRLLGAIMRLLDNHRGAPVSLVRIHRTDGKWQFPGFKLWFDVGAYTRDELRGALERASVLEADGLFIAHYDVEFLPPFDTCQLYFYAIVTGEKLQALQKICELKGYGPRAISYHAFPTGDDPSWSQQAAAALSRYWPQQTWRQFGFRVKPGNANRPNGFRQQHQALYLTAFDHQMVSDIFIFEGEMDPGNETVG